MSSWDPWDRQADSYILTAANSLSLANMGAVVIEPGPWAYLSVTNQDVSTLADVEFKSITAESFDVDSMEAKDIHFTGTVYTDIISEQTEDEGVTIDGVNIGDFKDDYDGKIDQDVQTTASPSFAALTLTGDLKTSGLVDTVDLAGFKSDYGLKVNQDLRTTASPSFVNLSIASKISFPTHVDANSALVQIPSSGTNNFITFDSVSDKSRWIRSRNGGSLGYSGHLFSSYDSSNFFQRHGTDPVSTAALCIFWMNNLITQPIQPTHTPIWRISYDGVEYVDKIKETTLDAGVTIETVLIKDGLVDGVDLSAFKTDYDSKVTQELKTTSTPSFSSISVNERIYRSKYETSTNFYWQANTLDILYVPLCSISYTRGRSIINVTFTITSPSASTVSLQLHADSTTAHYGQVYGTISHSGTKYINGISCCRATGLDPIICLVINKTYDYTINPFKIFVNGSAVNFSDSTDPRIDVLSKADTFWDLSIRTAKCLDNSTNFVRLPILPSTWGNGYYNACNNSYFQSNLYLERNDYLYEFKTSTLTNNRTLTLPDADLDLGSIPAANNNVPSSSNTRYLDVFISPSQLSTLTPTTVQKKVYSTGVNMYWEMTYDDDNLFGSIKMPEGYIDGEDIKMSVQWCNINDEISCNLNLGYLWANASSYVVTSSTSTSYNVSRVFAAGDECDLYEDDFKDGSSSSVIDGTGKDSTSIFSFRLKFTIVSGSGYMGLIGLKFHIPINAVGESS